MTGLEDDLAYLRDMAREDRAPVVRTGWVMVAVGLVFGAAALRAWAYQRSWLPPWFGFLPPLDAVFVFLSSVTVIGWRWPQAPATVRSRALGAALNSIGLSVVVTAAALGAAGRALEDPNLIQGFPAMLFILYGAGWWVAFSVTRRRWTMVVFSASIGFSMICASLAGSPEMWLALAVGLVLSVAVPGWLFARAERAG
jgi:hypothetical protein